MWGRTPTYKRESLRHTKEVGTITIQEGCASDLQGGGGAPPAYKKGEPQIYRGAQLPYKRGSLRHTKGGATTQKGVLPLHKGDATTIQERALQTFKMGGGHHHTREGHLRHTISRGFPIIYEGSSQTYKGGGGAITVQEGEHQT